MGSVLVWPSAATCSVHCEPSQYRCWNRPAGSGYQSAGGGVCVTSRTINDEAPPERVHRLWVVGPGVRAPALLAGGGAGEQGAADGHQVAQLVLGGLAGVSGHLVGVVDGLGGG